MTELKPIAAIEQLTMHQQQLDMDGVFVGVSRQALDEVLAYVTRADGWQDIADAPELERVRVAGWQPRSGTCQGYWWHHEDVICDGKAVDHPEATLWMPIHVPTFPTPPGGDHA